MEEGAIGKKGESEVDEKMAEDGDSREDGGAINGSGGVAEGVESDGCGWDVGGWLDDDIFLQPNQRQQPTRREKRATRKKYGLVGALDTGKKQAPMEGLSVTSQELQHLQDSDSLLAHVADLAGFFQRDGIMYRRWVPRVEGEENGMEQIIHPKECRKAVLHLAHTIPLGGHLGKKKTAAKIMRRFYWPTLFRDVDDFCKSCAECQKAGNRLWYPSQ